MDSQSERKKAARVRMDWIEASRREGMTLRALGRELGVSGERIRQLAKKAAWLRRAADKRLCRKCIPTEVRWPV